jgi:protein TonB
METSKHFSAFLLTLIFHAILLFGVRNQMLVKDVSLLPAINESIIKMQIMTEFARPVIKPLKKIKKVVPKKVQAKKNVEKVNKVIPVASPLPKQTRPSVDLREIERYALELRAYIEKNKFYPRMAKRLKQSGSLQLNIVINENGQFENVSMAKTTPFPILNKAAIKLVNKLGKFKPLPGSAGKRSFVIPIRYKL